MTSFSGHGVVIVTLNIKNIAGHFTKSHVFRYARKTLETSLKLECGPMPNLMVALPNIGGALCSTPQSLADAHYWVPCSNAAKTQKPLKFAGVPQTRQQISAVCRPKFTILWGHMEEISAFNMFLSDCRYMPQLRRYSPTRLCDGAKMAIFFVLYFQRAACSTFQTCVLNSH